ncbi:phosphopantothenoylcysteine decarboxylase domain-containing protein [Anaerocolumna xylanovorans]|uniref:Phosphopantothenate-cysteine ligase n=1 Tax=Anaerocolumna xylanovorans DSM 12503 TaxID=1121345 RepID=A0A1M7Y5D7_9FIRM|nr:phosphopantothenoylcysteine decarboxylase [Anaerocolumna xylanovorans]SHO47671.1 phosphopantothenate-cysteine ligase [Anaerocolumna xylanovorans DSM 12503]
MKILITAGGTTEPIDSVRSITNTSTGKLGSLTADAYGKLTDITKIYYVCGKSSILPQTEKAEVIFVDTVASLELAVSNILRTETVEIIIHSMAVSDYRVKAVTSAAMLADNLGFQLNSTISGEEQISEESIVSLFSGRETILSSEGKIRSNIKNLIICMEQTPKIISLYHTIAPQALLVGFKLLDNVPLKELLDTAFRLLQDNQCRFVLANDLQDISEEQHIGYLVDESRNYTKCATKKEIAEQIVRNTMIKKGYGYLYERDITGDYRKHSGI